MKCNLTLKLCKKASARSDNITCESLVYCYILVGWKPHPLRPHSRWKSQIQSSPSRDRKLCMGIAGNRPQDSHLGRCLQFIKQRARSYQDFGEECHRYDRRHSIQTVLRGALLAASRTQEGQQAQRGRRSDRQETLR